MLGKIVKVEGTSGHWDNLMVVVGFENNTDSPYDYKFKFVPYFSDQDDLKVDLSLGIIDYRCCTANIGDFIQIQEEKLHYTKYGESNIRGVKHIYLERKWDEIKIPTR